MGSLKPSKTFGFNIGSQTNLNKEVDFLEAIMNLENGTYLPYKGPNDKLITSTYRRTIY